MCRTHTQVLCVHPSGLKPIYFGNAAARDRLLNHRTDAEVSVTLHFGGDIAQLRHFRFDQATARLGLLDRFA